MDPFAEAVEIQEPTQQPESSGDPFADTVPDDRPSQEATTKVQGGKGTPEDPFRPIIEYKEKLDQAFKLGQYGFRESALGHAVKSGSMTLEEAEKQIEADNTLAELSGDVQSYQDNAWKESWILGIGSSFGIETAKQMPMIIESLKPAAGGAAVGGGAALATGAGAPFAVPAAAGTGLLAAAGWTADLITGQSYLSMRREGLDHDTASFWAPVSGTIQGSLSGVRLSHVGKLAAGAKAAENAIKSHLGQTLEFMFEGLKSVGIQTGLAEASTATDLITKAIAGTVSKTPGAVPTVEEAVDAFVETFKSSIFGGTGIFLGAKTAGGFLSALKKVCNRHLRKQREITAKQKEKAAQEDLQDQEQEAQEAEDAAKAAAAAQKKPKAPNYDKVVSDALRRSKREAAETEVARIVAAANAKFLIITPESRLRETNRIQRLVKRMISNSDKLDDAMKVKLLKRIPEIDGTAALERMGQDLIDDVREREYANDLAAANKRLQGVIAKGQQKDGKAVIDGVADQTSLRWYKEFFTPPELDDRPAGSPKRAQGEAAAETRQKALERAQDAVNRAIDEEVKAIDRQVEKLENNELAELFEQPGDLVEKRRIAMEAWRYWANAMRPDEIQDLADSIEQTVAEGKSAFKQRKEAEAQRRLNERAKVAAGVQGSKPVVPSQAETAPKQMTAIGRVLNSVRRNSSALWDKLLQDTPVDEREKIANVLDFTAEENREFALNLRATEKLTDLYTKAVGSMREVNRLVRNGTKSELFKDGYTDATGESATLGRHSINELAYLHLAFEDGSAVPGLVKGNKYTLDGMVEAGETSTQTAVRNILQQREGGKYLKLAEAVREFYRWNAPNIANHYLHEYGVPLKMEPNYSGQIFHRHIERIKSAADLLKGVHDYAQSNLSPGSIKERTNSAMPIKAYDPFVQVQRHRAEMNFWIANSEKARQLSFIFSDTSKDGLRDVIAHKLGAEYNSLIDGRLAWQFHLKPGIMDVADRSYQAVKNNMATGLLGGRIDQAPKQWTSVLAALSTNDYGQFVDGLREATKKGAIKEYLSRSDVYRDRQSDLIPRMLEATKERSFVDAITGDRAFDLKKAGLIPMSDWGDGVASALAGFIEYNRVKKAGGTVQEAVLAGDRLVDRTQSSSRMGQKVPAEFKGGVSNLSLSFAKQGIQMINLESGAIRDWFIHKDDVHLARMVRTVVAVHAAQTIFQAINSVPAFLVGDEDEQADALVRIASAALGGSYVQTPLVSFDVIAGAISGFQGQQEPRTIIGGLAADSAKLVKRWWTITGKLTQGEEIEGEEWVRGFSSLASSASLLSGLPFWGIWQYTKLGSKVADKAQGIER